MADYYTILGATTSTTHQELKQRYFNLVRQHHPDKNGNSDAFRRLDRAWKVLGNEQSRKHYDAEMKSRECQFSHPVDAELCLKDLIWNSELKQYEKLCRCGGKYILSEEDVLDDLISIDCDDCSLSIVVDCDSSKNQIFS